MGVYPGFGVYRDPGFYRRINEESGYTGIPVYRDMGIYPNTGYTPYTGYTGIGEHEQQADH